MNNEKELLVLKLRNGEDIICEVEYENEDNENSEAGSTATPSPEGNWLIIKYPLRLIQQFNFQNGNSSLHMIPWNPFSDEPISYLSSNDVIHYSKPSMEIAGNYMEITEKMEHEYEVKMEVQAQIEEGLEQATKEVKTPEDFHNFMQLMKFEPNPDNKN